MKVIVLGSANKECFLPSRSLKAIPKNEDLRDLLTKLRGRKLELEDYGRRLCGASHVYYRFTLRRRAAKRRIIECIGPRSVQLSPGGSAFSIAICLARFGAEVHLATPLPELPRDFFDEAIARGVHILPSFGNQANPISFIIWGLSRGEERSIVFPFKPTYVLNGSKTLSAIRAEEGITHVIATGIRKPEELRFIANVFKAVRKKNQNAFTYFMPNAAVLLRGQVSLRRRKRALYIRRELKGVLRYTSVWQMNLRESRVYLGNRGRLSFPDRVHELSRAAGVPITIITCGSHGAGMVVNDGRRRQYYPVDALTVEAVDTAGAGDAFAVGLFCGLELMKDKPMKDKYAVSRFLAAFAAGKNIEKVGGWAWTPSHTGMRRYLNKLRRENVV